MRIKDFVFKVSKELQSIQFRPEQLAHNEKNYVFLVSQRIIFGLQKLLAKYAHAEIEATEESLQPFMAYLKKCWDQLLIDTDALAFHNCKTHANQILEFLSLLSSQMTNYNQLELQFPGIVINAVHDACEINRMLISDDKRTFIDPLKCLEMARQSADHRLRHTHPVAGQSEFLSPNEAERVIKYNPKAERFYKDIIAGASTRALDKAHNNLRKRMGGEVLSTYGEAGRIRLQSRLYGGINTCEQLVNALQAYPRNVWGKFLDNYSLLELHQIVFNTNTDQKNQQPISDFLCDELFRKHRDTIHNQKDLIHSLSMYPRSKWKAFLNQFELSELIALTMLGPPILDAEKKQQNNVSDNDEDIALTYLSNTLYQRLRSTIRDKESFLSAAQNFQPIDWPLLLKKFETHELNELMLDNKTYDQMKFNKTLHDANTYSSNELYNSLTSFTLLDLYRRDLASRPNDYNTFWGWASGYASPKTAKEKVSLIAYKLLAQGTKLSELKAKVIEVIHSDEQLSTILSKATKLTQSERKLLIKAANEGTFGQFLNQTSLISQPMFNAAQRKSQQVLGRH